MTVIIRALWILLTLPFRDRAVIDAPSSMTLRPMPHETGFAFAHHHVILALAEVGRWDLLLRAGKTVSGLRKGYLPVVASQLVRYRRPIRRFRAVELVTHIVFWDEKDAYVEHTFRRRGEVQAKVLARFRFPKGKRTTSPIEIMREEWGVEPPPAPPWLEAWKAGEQIVTDPPPRQAA